MTNEELEHFGILGMHWGKKKGSVSTVKKTSSSKSKYIKVGAGIAVGVLAIVGAKYINDYNKKAVMESVKRQFDANKIIHQELYRELFGTSSGLWNR